MVDEVLEGLYEQLSAYEKQLEYLYTQNLCNEDWSKDIAETERWIKEINEDIASFTEHL